MNDIDRALHDLAAKIVSHSAAAGHPVELAKDILTERSVLLGLDRPGSASANGACRMLDARDGWLAVNLPRDSDWDLAGAWIGRRIDPGSWSVLAHTIHLGATESLAEDGQRLGLAVARVGSVRAPRPEAKLHRLAMGGSTRPDWRLRPPKVLDMSSLWAGPLCGDVLALAGADVVKLESVSRPDVVRGSSGAFYHRLNGRKRLWSLDFASNSDIARLRTALAEVDVLITSARPRAFEQLGIVPLEVFAVNQGLVWVAVTAYGWWGQDGLMVGFGDDTAAAGGLVDWSDTNPRFLGDALADPITGLAAAIGAFRALSLGGGFLVDAALARTAAGVVGSGCMDDLP